MVRRFAVDNAIKYRGMRFSDVEPMGLSLGYDSYAAIGKCLDSGTVTILHRSSEQCSLAALICLNARLGSEIVVVAPTPRGALTLDLVAEFSGLGRPRLQIGYFDHAEGKRIADAAQEIAGRRILVDRDSKTFSRMAGVARQYFETSANRLILISHAIDPSAVSEDDIYRERDLRFASLLRSRVARQVNAAVLVVPDFNSVRQELAASTLIN